MEEKTEELYQKYLEERLNMIFNDGSKDGVKHKHCVNNKYKRSINNRERKQKIEIECYKVGRYGEYNFRNSNNGELISDIWYDEVSDFHDGYALVRKGRRYNFIDSNGELISDTWYRGAWDFHDGLARVKLGDFEYNYIDTEGNLLLDDCVEDAKDFENGYAIVTIDWDLYNYIDTDGNMISNELHAHNSRTAYYHCYRCNNSFAYWEKEDNGYCFNYTEVINKNLCGYHVKKKMIKYECRKDDDVFKVKYRPISIYGSRYVLCFDVDEDNVIMYDRGNKSYKIIGSPYNIEFDELFIYDKKNKKVYFMIEDKMIDITNYYNKYLIDKSEITVTSGISILSKEDFFYHSEEEIRELLQKEREEEKRKQKEKEKLEEQEKLQALKEQDIKDQTRRDIKEKEALYQIQKSLKALEELERATRSFHKMEVNNLFVVVQDHLEIYPRYLELGLLKHIDLSLHSFKNVKMEGIDFRGCNIHLIPQEVYGKSLRNCNFEGVYIDPFVNFAGIDIRGARFSQDGDWKTLDFFNGTFGSAIYDETTTYNGIPVTELIKKSNRRK